MEANQTTCPQCGLANNALAEACIQCGIIFIKQSAQEPPATPDHQKRKEIEEAETMTDETPKPPVMDAFTNEIIQRPDPHEDTVEMPIPMVSAAEKKSEAAAPLEPEPEKDKNSDNLEIEMEAIEAAMENVGETVDAEALFLSEVNPNLTAQSAAPEAVQKQDAKPSEPEKSDDQRGETLKSDADKPNSQASSAEVQPQKQSAGNPMAEFKKEENPKEKETGETQNGVAASAKTEKAASPVAEGPKYKDHLISGFAAPPKEQKIKPEEKPESTMAETAAAPAETKTFTNTTIEMPKELSEESAQADQQAEKAKKDALKKQREALMKAEALEKQKAANAEALKKKKLAQARADALRNQRAAEIKAEALKKKKEALARAQASKKQEATRAKADVLKKQKEAQARVEASSHEIQLASSQTPKAAAAGTSHHERLLGLLKRYKGKAIGINYDNSSEIREAELVDANEEFFSVRVKDKKLQYSYPLKTILTIVEGREGVETGEGDQKAKFDAVIKVFPLVLL